MVSVSVERVWVCRLDSWDEKGPTTAVIPPLIMFKFLLETAMAQAHHLVSRQQIADDS